MKDDDKTLTTRQGHPVADNQSLRSVGERGPATLENYQFIEKITHFDRERIPERVVHARGTGAHGWFEAFGKIGDEPASKYTRAKVLTQTGVRTPVFVRFSTVIGSKDSPETARDPRGFAVKLKTVDGNWDLVGNNLKVFFIRDAIKFPDMIHAFKPDPVTNRQEPWRFYDFVSQSPEALHMVTWVKSPWGIPANYREMEGSGVNTYKLVNDEGIAHLVKFHWQPKQGVRNLTAAQAAEIKAKNVGHATQDLYESIERGEFPEWTLCVQIMSDDPHEELDFDPLDDTKRWPEDQFPLLPVGRMVLDRNPDNFLPRLSKPPSAPACSSRASISRMTRCCKAAPCPIQTRSATASGPITCNCRSTRPRKKPRRAPTSAMARWRTLSMAPAKTSTSTMNQALWVDSRRRRSRPKIITSGSKVTLGVTKPRARLTTTSRRASVIARSRSGSVRI